MKLMGCLLFRRIHCTKRVVGEQQRRDGSHAGVNCRDD
jgi:hypothetical protein